MRLRNQKLDIEGRSLLLNLLGIVLNLVGVFFVVKGFHESTVDLRLVYQLLGAGLIVITLIGLFMLQGMYLFSYVARALVGGLFIVSGLIKANDPWGFAFKLEEYFAPDGLSYDWPFFEFFEPYALHLSILICVVEIVLGIAVIVGGKIKLASWSLILMMAFFTWLTWYTASCNASQLAAMEAGTEFNRQCVTDCGCFGDALRGSVGRSLTPLESFWKDLVLFYFVLIIFVNQWKIKLNSVRENWVMVPASILVVIFFSWVFGWLFPIFFALIALLGAFVAGELNITKMAKDWKMAIYVAVLSLLFSVYTSMYLPVKDYRPYAIGNNIKDEMSKGEPEIADFQWIYTNKKTGEDRTFKTEEYEVYGDTSTWVYKDRIKVVIKEGVMAPITDFLASIDFEKLSDEEKKNAIIDSLIQWDYQNYYEEKMVLKHAYGNDTIAAWEYDTLYYPDSIYTFVNKYEALIDPFSPFVLDLTSYILNVDYVFLMTIRDIEAVSPSHIPDFKAVYEKATEAGIPFYVLSPATDEQIEAFAQKYDFRPTFLAFDGTEVKIIVRSNPGLVLLNNGTVLDKWPCRSVPDFEDIQEDYLPTIEQ